MFIKLNILSIDMSAINKACDEIVLTVHLAFVQNNGLESSINLMLDFIFFYIFKINFCLLSIYISTTNESIDSHALQVLNKHSIKSVILSTQNI